MNLTNMRGVGETVSETERYAMTSYNSKLLTTLERKALAALVREYGPEYIIDVVQFIGFELAENEYNQATKEGKL